MSESPASGIERLWRRDELERKPRLGLSLERVVQSGVELADAEGLAAVSMKRVAERLGFTTMAVYRYVTSKDELLLLMQDTVWQPPAGLDVPPESWRAGLVRWAREQCAIMQQHPWLDEVRYIERAGTPSQIAWMDLGLRALAGVALSEYQKVSILLLVSGLVSNQARLETTMQEGSRRGLFAPEQGTEAFGELLRAVIDPGRFPALHHALEGGAFAPTGGPTYAPFDFGLEIILDGVERLLERQASA